jgi:hypothetical protein
MSHPKHRRALPEVSHGGDDMRCETCGNDYDGAMEIRVRGERHVFDCFECAIHALAPACDHCGCRIIGHGVQAGERMFCCAHCAQHEGVEALRDRA